MQNDITFAPREAALRMSSTLLDMLWKDDHFVLQDICVKGECRWPDAEDDTYEECIAAVSDYLFDLDVSFVGVKRSRGESGFSFRASVPDIESGLEDIVPHDLCPDEASWIIYVPFEPCVYGAEDPAYFADCFEVVREMVEDGLVQSAATVCGGGLRASLKSLCSQMGASVDISDIMRSYGEPDPDAVLDREAPGVLIQIADSDFDYLDAEMLLQDVAYYPLGHPFGHGLSIRSGSPAGVSGILDSLLR